MSNSTISMEENFGEKSYAADLDGVTRSRHYGRQFSTCQLDGESRLLFAVLEDAVRCVLLHRPSFNCVKRRELFEAMAWVNTRGDHDLFSFDSICELFEIQPEKLRRRLNAFLHPLRVDSNTSAIPSSRTVQRAPVAELNGVVARHPAKFAAAAERRNSIEVIRAGSSLVPR